MTERALPVTILEPAGIDPDLLDHTLSLRFDLGQFDPRITFTRNSSATYFGSDGLLKTASANEPRIDYDPVTKACKGFLVEESRTNLLTYSEQFDKWLKVRASVTANTIVAPNGTLTADKLVEDTASGTHFLDTLLSGTTNANPYTASFYVKYDGRHATIQVYSSPTVATLATTVFNLSTGSIFASSQSTGVTQSPGIISVGNGWYRIWTTVTLGTADTSVIARLRLSDLALDSYIGDGTSGVHIWGAQLEVGAFPTSYIPTPAVFTSRNSTGTYFDSTGVMKTAAINEARYDHGYVNGKWVSKGLLLEDARTNLVLSSEIMGAQLGVSILANDALAPDNTLTMDRVVETATTGEHYPTDHTFTPTAGTTYTWSCFAKRPSGGAERNLLLRVGAGNLAFVYFSLNDGSSSIAVASQYVSHGSVHVGGGIYRCWLTWRADSATTTVCRTQLGTTGNVFSYTGDGTSGIYMWGRQLEVGSSPTSYIKTQATTITRAADLSTSSAVTRAADSAVMTGTNFSSWYRQDEGTFVAAADSLRTSGNAPIVTAQAAGGTNRHQMVVFSPCAGTVLGGVAQALIGANATQTVSAAYAYKANDFAVSVAGGAPSVDMSGTVPTAMTYMTIGKYDFGGAESLNGHVRRLSYYPKRLSNAKLQALTQ